MGVSIQLHTTLLIVMPIVTLCTLAYIFFKKKSIGIWKSILTIILFFLVLNTSQIISEFDSHGQNTRYFFKGFGASSSKHLGKELFLISACQIEANTHMITSLQSDEACSTVFQPSKDNNKYLFFIGMSLSVLFSLVGYFLLGKRFKEEKDIKKKNFLGLVIFFNLISFIILVPIANIIFVGYFINLFFIPLVLLGLMIEFIQNKYPKIGKDIGIVMITMFLASSLVINAKAADSYRKGLENNDKNSTLSEVESISKYILSTHPQQYSKQYLAGEAGLAERFFRPVNYFTKNSGVETNLLKAGDEKKVETENVIYYLKKNDSNEIAPRQTIWGHEIISGKKLSGLTILILKK